uniref:NAD(P)-binding protein n=1 Tax=Polytomella parva TaxID=51329 RepID=A0A7S0UUM4_9CHLO|mmetsp:Transcript_18520/g.33674  ORF Transcript_18520/g.33674 Transcript_18520/m.33674 type:complete len:378 (+) Transcript_18520:117-1250(+)
MGLNLSCALTIATAYGAYKLVRLCYADADLDLLSKGKVPKNSFQDKVIWITGASQGLGRMMALYLAQQGAFLILSSRSKEKLMRVKKECLVSDDRVTIVPFDICGSDEELQTAVDSAVSSFGGRNIDILIHMAGASQHSIAADTSPQVSRSLLDLNGLAPIRLTRLVLPYLLQPLPSIPAPSSTSPIPNPSSQPASSRIVFIGSMAAKVPSPGQSSYSAAKMAAYGYFATLASELADSPVKITIVLPGPVASPEASRTVYGNDGLKEIPVDPAAKGRLPLDRAVQHIAAAIAHGVDEAWISKHPVLAMAYVQQYAPSLAMRILKRIGPKRARALQEGRSGYDPNALLRGKEKEERKGTEGEKIEVSENEERQGKEWK